MGHRASVILFVNVRSTPHEARQALYAAAQLGVEPVVVADRPIDYPVTECLVCDTYDLAEGLAAAERLASRHDIKGVVTWGDRDVELVSLIAEELGLPGPSRRAAHRARNKIDMRRALEGSPGTIPRFAPVSAEKDLEDAIRTVGLPAILKPASSSGSTGIFELREPEDSAGAHRWLREIVHPDADPVFRRDGTDLILEEYLDGREVSVEGWVHRGEPIVAGITDKWTTDSFHLEYQHVFPARLTPEESSVVRSNTAEVVRALELDNCAFHLECKLTSRGFRLIEVAARIAGDFITSHLVPMSTGTSFYAGVIRVAMGNAPPKPDVRRLHTGIRFILADQSGTFDGLEGEVEVLRQPTVEPLFLLSDELARIALPPEDFTSQRVAAVIARDPSYDSVIAALEKADAVCRPRVRT